MKIIGVSIQFPKYKLKMFRKRKQTHKIKTKCYQAGVSLPFEAILRTNVLRSGDILLPLTYLSHIFQEVKVRTSLLACETLISIHICLTPI